MPRIFALIPLICATLASALGGAPPDLRVGAAAVVLEADDSMPVAGRVGILRCQGQEGELRAVAVVIEKPGGNRVVVVACDVLVVLRDIVDPAVAEIVRTTGIAAENILINATHTHHAPSVSRCHDWDVSHVFRERLRRGIVESVQQANARLAGARFHFHLGEETTVGANSRILLENGGVTWINPLHESRGGGRPTGPFDPQLPVLDFRGPSGRSIATIYNHSTHTIGTRGGNVRSPSFYGLAAQELEQDLGGIVSFLEGASGSTHNITGVPVGEAVRRMRRAVSTAREGATPRPVEVVAAIRRPFRFRVRVFDDDDEDRQIARYAETHLPQHAAYWRKLFASMRDEMRPYQGEERETWIQAMRIGDVAIVGVPGEYFTGLGVDIKRRSPFPHTVIAGLANDSIGYLPDREAYGLGGYQVWTGLHSYAQKGTGERMADAIVGMLGDLAGQHEVRHDRSASTPSPRSPAEERAALQLADPRLTLELVAAEPDVTSPVAVAWDANGRMFVTEMIGYPQSEGLGRIRRLEDRDGDGRYEHSMVFADGLNFPTCAMPYRHGVFVATAPDILFLADTDDDGRADTRRVEWTGFGLGSQQLRANALHLSLDNWIYGANGRRDGTIRRPDAPAESAVSIRARDFRFDPRTGKFEAIAGQSQFGQVHDDLGNRFLSWNTIPIRHAVIPDRYLVSRPGLASRAVVDSAAPQDTGRIFPIGPPPRQFNAERPDYYNALCGLTIFRGDALGPEYRGNAFVGESLTNLVTRRRLTASGPTFVSHRIEKSKEFLASSDGWFHPVNLATGPDGALYVVDFYRELVEHPIYIASLELRKSVDWRRGHEHGRIWRVRRRERHRSQSVVQRLPRLDDASTETLVRHLGHPVGWWRDTAQRLLVERGGRSAVVPLRRLATGGDAPLARLHALWTLAGLDALEDDVLAAGLDDIDPRIREHAMRLCEDRLTRSDRLRRAVLGLADDTDPRLRFQLALTLGSVEGDPAREVLRGLVASAPEDRWIARAVLSSPRHRPDELVRDLVRTDRDWLESPTKERVEFLVAAGRAVGRRADGTSRESFLRWLVDPGSVARGIDGRVAVLAGLARSIGRRGVAAAGVTVAPAVRLASDIAVDVRRPTVLRLLAIEVLALGDPAAVGETLEGILASGETVELQAAACRAVADLDDVEASRRLYDHWSRYGRVVRRAILAASVRSTGARTALLGALEDARVLAIEVPVEVADELRKTSGEKLRERIVAALGEPASVDRIAVVSRYRASLDMAGRWSSGALLFREHCLTCHTIPGAGVQVGPDLSAVGSRPREALIADILDPSRQVSPDFLAYTVATDDGKVLTGLIVAETPEAITLRRAGGDEVTVPVSRVLQIRASGTSLMPDGMEEKIELQDLADLLEFLRQPDRAIDPVMVGRRKQLFVDDHVVARRSDVRRELGKVEKANGGKPIFIDGGFYGTVLHDDGIFKMWWRKPGSAGFGYAESRDGLRFRKVADVEGLNFAGDYTLSVTIDLHDADPLHRFKAAYDAPGMAAGLAHSTDGIHWQPYNGGKPVTGRAADTYNQIIRDEDASTYLLFTRTDFGSAGGRGEVRGHRVMANPDVRADPEAWTTIRSWIFDREGPDEVMRRQIYALTDWIHHGVHFALMSVYEWPGDVSEGPEDFHRRHERDVMNFYIGTGRDGHGWDTSWVYGGEPIIPRGGDGAFDKDIIIPASSIVTHDDRHWLYYVGANERHGTEKVPFSREHAIGVATLRLDGFVGLAAGERPGVVVTRPFRLDGKGLEVNVDARGGSIRVSVLDGMGAPVPGYAAAAAARYDNIDALRLRPRWAGQGDLADLEGRVVRFEFALVGAKLYSFQITQ